MASKNMATSKRKSAPSGKAANHGPLKKQKLQAQKEKKPRVEESEPWSTDDDDDDEGGVTLDLEDDFEAMDVEDLPQKPNKTNGNTASNNQTSRERHEEQKRLARERKLAKPFGEQLHRLKKIWERLRRKSHVPKEERQTLVKELFDITTGHFKELVMKHDAVRIVQTALKYSTPMQRKCIARELQGSYVSLASNKYSKFLIDKLLGYEDDEIRDLIIPEFYGRVRKLMLHPDAGWVLDDIYRKAATKEQKSRLLREWYGPEFAIFKDVDGEAPVTDLSKIIEQEPSKRGSIMKSLKDLIDLMIKKGFTSFTSLHDAMLQYFGQVRPGTDEHRQFIDVCVDPEGDIPKHLPFTSAGSHLASLILAHGTAKDRKSMIRGFKDAVQMMSIDTYGHLVILVAYEVVDDTVLVSKSIISQILAPSSEENKHEVVHLAANDLFARTTLLYLFDGPSKALFPSQLSRDLGILKEVADIRETTSKKDSAVRRAELVDTVSKPLLAAIAEMPNDMATTPFGAQFVADVLLGATGEKEAAVQAVAALASGDTNDPVHLANYPFTGRMFKALVQGGKFDKAQGKIIPVSPPLRFADAFYEHIQGQEVGWATGPSSFAVLSLLECDDFSERKTLKKVLRKNKSMLEKAVNEPPPKKEDEEEDAKKPKKNRKGQDKKAVGNMGAKLILEKLD
ncbi:putative cpl domain-containing protein [Zalerion maritima]|uniref:Cpl domain-containing protein n=1 Tax=Zalerion maritima TaxID=339359 RepID=A0AAD5RLA1_9PEZI|nr:putative cpl domain-containing protein [Zalerion maritima]